VDEGTAAEGQLIAALGFVVVQSFHGPLRLSGKTGRKRSGKMQLDRSRGRGHHRHLCLDGFKGQGYATIWWSLASTADEPRPPKDEPSP
jgi:hypothetical protein